jgi:hypothetical protein
MQNRVLAAVSIVGVLTAMPCRSAESALNTGVGYKTVNEALAALKASPGANITVTKPDGWIIANEREKDTQWSFTPEGHYAHPSVVKRIIKQDGRGVYIEMSALCEGTKSNCDKLLAEFEQLNERIRESVRARLGSSGKR